MVVAKFQVDCAHALSSHNWRIDGTGNSRSLEMATVEIRAGSITRIAYSENNEEIEGGELVLRVVLGRAGLGRT